MEKVLLVASDSASRQLYHELLQSKNIEVLPADNITDAIVLLMLNKYLVAVINVDEQIKSEVFIFLKLREKHANLSRIKVVLLSPETSQFSPFLKDRDFILNSKELTPQEISDRVVSLLKLIRI